MEKLYRNKIIIIININVQDTAQALNLNNAVVCWLLNVPVTC